MCVCVCVCVFIPINVVMSLFIRVARVEQTETPQMMEQRIKQSMLYNEA